MNAAPYLTEATVDQVIAALRTNMPAAIAAISAARGDNLVGMERIRTFYTIENPKAFEAPACLVLAPTMDLQQSTTGANFITGKSDVFVSIIVEDTDSTHLIRKARRYQAAAFKVLHRARLTTPDNAVTLAVVVDKLTISLEFKNSDRANHFRREVLLECKVEHLEKE